MWQRAAKPAVAGERRHMARVHANGSVIVHASRPSHGRIVDVSTGGVRFHVVETDAVSPGARVTLHLRLDGANQRWVHLGGRIGRVTADGTVCVAFFGVPTEFEDVVQDQLLSELECDSQRHALVVDPDRARRERTAHRLRATGWHVTETSSPLGAIDHLGEASAHPSVVFVARTSPAGAGEELRRYLAREHREIRVRSLDAAWR